MDDLADLDDALVASSAPELAPYVPAASFAAALARIHPDLEQTVAGFAQGRIRMDDPQERGDLADLHHELDRVIKLLAAVRSGIDTVFLTAARERNAKEIPLPEGRKVVYEAPRGSYTGDFRAMRRELAELAALHGDLPPDVVQDALREEVVVTPDHRKLNAIKARYGARAAAIIDGHRTFVVEGTGRVRYPR